MKRGKRNYCIQIRISVHSERTMKKVQDWDCCYARTLLWRMAASCGSHLRKEKGPHSISLFRWRSNQSHWGDCAYWVVRDDNISGMDYIQGSFKEHLLLCSFRVIHACLYFLHRLLKSQYSHFPLSSVWLKVSSGLYISFRSADSLSRNSSS